MVQSQLLITHVQWYWMISLSVFSLPFPLLKYKNVGVSTPFGFCLHCTPHFFSRCVTRLFTFRPRLDSSYSFFFFLSVVVIHQFDFICFYPSLSYPSLRVWSSICRPFLHRMLSSFLRRVLFLHWVTYASCNKCLRSPKP